jgi:predicted lipoprotein with Yx(FWY)xxD motif
MPSRIASACVIVTAILSAACGSAASSATSTSPAASPSASSSPSVATVAVIKLGMTSVGDVLVDGSGRTIYLFVADKGTTSVCYNSCAEVWPPVLTAGTPQAGAGVNASLLGTTARTDGTTEVTYGGHPLYYFISDKKPGDITGQAVNNFGAPWYVVAASGEAVK